MAETSPGQDTGRDNSRTEGDQDNSEKTSSTSGSDDESETNVQPYVAGAPISTRQPVNPIQVFNINDSSGVHVGPVSHHHHYHVQSTDQLQVTDTGGHPSSTKIGAVSKAQDSEEVKLLHQKLYLTMYDALRPEMDDYYRFLIMIRTYLPSWEVEKCKNITNILEMLEDKKIICIGFYDKLINVLFKASLYKIVKEVKELSREIADEIKKWNRSMGKTTPETDYVSLIIVTLNGRRVGLTADRSATVYALKRLYQERFGPDQPGPDQQRLLRGGKQWEDGRTLVDYNVDDHSTIHLALRMKGGFRPPGPVNDFLKTRWRKAFQFFDVDRDGRLTTKDSEAMAGYISKATDASPEETNVTRAAWVEWLPRLIPSITHDGITEDVFVKACGEMYQARHEGFKFDVVRSFCDLFDIIDRNKDHEISLDELEMFYAAAGLTDEGFIKKIFNIMDKINTRGLISRKDFVCLMETYWSLPNQSDELSAIFNQVA